MILGCSGCLHLRPIYVPESGTVDARCMRPIEIAGEKFWPSHGLSVADEVSGREDSWRSPRCGPARQFREHKETDHAAA